MITPIAPPSLALQRSTRLPISVTLALMTCMPPLVDVALQCSIVLATSKALAPEYTASPPVLAKQKKELLAGFLSHAARPRGREGTQCGLGVGQVRK